LEAICQIERAMSRTWSGAQVVRGLRWKGFEPIGQKGSHVKLRNYIGRVVIVPMHAEVRIGTLHSILRQAGLTLRELVDVMG
jgi:predicted RNA binding protein YcfA (HicA-like mRNA interferase family)